MAAIALLEGYDAAELRALARRSNDARQVRRLLALAAAYDGARRGEAFKANFPPRIQEIRDHLPAGTPLEIWFDDEARIGQKNKITRRWARRGTRPSAPKD